MKKNLFVWILLGIVCVSCGYEDSMPQPSSDSKIISLFSRGTPVPDTSDKIPERTFQEKDSIGLYLVRSTASLEEERYAENALFVWQGNKFVAETKLFYPDDQTSLNFLAYYPYRSEGIATGSSLLPVKVAADQRSEKEFLRSDFMTAYKKSVEPSQESVNLVFFHRLSRLDIAVKPGKEYNMESLKNADITVVMKDVYTSCLYHEEKKEFTTLARLSDVSPYTDIVATEDSLSGWSFIMIPQTIAAGKSFIEVLIDGKSYSFTYEADRTFVADKRVKLTLTLESEKDLGITETDISDWSESVYEEGDLKPKPTPKVEIEAMDFNRSAIWHIVSPKQELLGVVCREYLCSEELKSVAITYYAAVDGTPDYTEGEVLYLMEEAGKSGGGKITWQEDENRFEYTPAERAPLTAFYISPNGEITTDAKEGVFFTLSPELVKDVDENEYGVVKVGKQCWMTSNLRTSSFRDGTLLTEVTDKFPEGKTPAPAYRLHASGEFSEYGFYYNGLVVAGDIAPAGWKVAASTDWVTLRNYTINALPLKDADSWTDDSGNESGITVLPDGYIDSEGGIKINVKNTAVEQAAYFLCTDDSYYISLGTGEGLRRGTVGTEVYGAHIRCLKE
ncbi:MAG: fimbrillin family protein [Bacteroides sp.]|nr:fimbrillin family protein [Bacteroides sp.]